MSTIYVNDNPYYLRQLKFNPVNDNKFVYFSAFDGSIKIYENQWLFNFDFYLNQNLNLPANTLLVNISLPFCEIKKETLSKIEKTNLPDYIIDKTSCCVYQSSFILDVSQNSFFDNQLVNYVMYMNINFTLSEEALNTAKLDNNPDDINKFINEFNSMSTFSNFAYTNYYVNSQTNSYEISNEYNFINGKVNTNNPKLLFYDVNSYENMNLPITKLLSINFDGSFVVKGYKINFSYEIENTNEIKQLTYENKTIFNCKNQYDFNFQYGTHFDFEKKEIVLDLTSEKGFFIPLKSTGYYEVTFLICANNMLMTFKIINNFNFKQSSSDFSLKSKNYFINNLQNFNHFEVH